AYKQQTKLADYMRWLQEHRGLHFHDYDELWRWSVSELEAFWVSICDYCQVKFHEPYRTVLADRHMPGAQWFEGATLNWAEHAFRNATDQRPALIFRSETQGPSEISWQSLRDDTARVAAQLRAWG